MLFSVIQCTITKIFWGGSFPHINQIILRRIFDRNYNINLTNVHSCDLHGVRETGNAVALLDSSCGIGIDARQLESIFMVQQLNYLLPTMITGFSAFVLKDERRLAILPETKNGEK